MSCLKTSFTVFSRTDYELELSSRRVAARTRVGWTYSKMPARPLQLRRVAISSLLRSGISKPAESENYVLKSHTCPGANYLCQLAHRIGRRRPGARARARDSDRAGARGGCRRQERDGSDNRWVASACDRG